jgi:GTPase SAR1 family protein
MSNTTSGYITLDDIVKQADMPKIIVIGGGGLGKTTLVNKITNAKFNVSQTTSDGTIDFQGASFDHNGTSTLLVDSPGFRFNEDKWWNGVLQIKKIIGIIVMHEYQHRNTGYSNFGYVLAYLNRQQTNRVKKFLVNHSTLIPADNYMAGSIPVQHSDHDIIYQDVQEWLQQLDGNSTMEIFSPTALIQQYYNKLGEVDTLRTAMNDAAGKYANITADQARTIEGMKVEIRTLQEEKQRVENSSEQLKEILNELPSELAYYDKNSKGYLPDAPHGVHYLYSWLPLIGIAHLRSLRTKAEKDHSVAIRVLDKIGKKKKN